MSRRDEVRRAREILAIRALQRQAAEQEVERAAMRCKALADACGESHSRLSALHENWSASVIGPSLSLAMAGAWSSALDREAGALLDLEKDLGQAREDGMASAEVWRGALANEEAAEILSRKTAREARRRLHENVMNETADRAARQVAVR